MFLWTRGEKKESAMPAYHQVRTRSACMGHPVTCSSLMYLRSSCGRRPQTRLFVRPVAIDIEREWRIDSWTRPVPEPEHSPRLADPSSTRSRPFEKYGKIVTLQSMCMRNQRKLDAFHAERRTRRPPKSSRVSGMQPASCSTHALVEPLLGYSLDYLA